MEHYNLYQQARALGVCSMLTGTESTRELMQLLFTPPGVEFCTKHNFPDMETAREFRGEVAQAHGIYIDAGSIELRNPRQVALIGNTRARLHYDDPSKAHQVITMHGASASIAAQGYAVVFITGENIEYTTTDNAKVL